MEKKALHIFVEVSVIKKFFFVNHFLECYNFLQMSLFITIEGPEGSGKSTQVSLLARYLKNKGYKVLCTREPGGTPVGERIRRILLEPKFFGLDPVCELLLYCAQRAEHTKKVIRKALEEGKIVLCERYIDSTIAYQVYGRGIDEKIVRILNDFCTDKLLPDLTIILDIPPKLSLKNKKKRLDRIEREPLEFHEKVREGYGKIAQEGRARLIRVTDKKSTQEMIRRYVDEFLNSCKFKG